MYFIKDDGEIKLYDISGEINENVHEVGATEKAYMACAKCIPPQEPGWYSSWGFDERWGRWNDVYCAFAEIIG